jgi:hypothetical protein
MYQSNQVQFDWTILFDMEYSILVPVLGSTYLLS